MSLFCSLPFLDPQGLWNEAEVWTPQEGIGDAPPSAPLYPPTPPSCWPSCQKWLTVPLCCLPQPIPSPSLKCLLYSLDPNPHYHLQAQSKSHLPCDAGHLSAQLEVGLLVSSLTAHFIGILGLGFAPCLVLFVITWSDIHIWKHYFS